MLISTSILLGILMENGAKVKDIQSCLGHGRSAITIDAYSHLTQKTQNESVDGKRMANHYFSRFTKTTNCIPTTINPHPSAILP